MAESASVNCSGLDVRTSFAAYIASLEEATHGNYNLAVKCKEQLCTALWGSGNADISGIGMITGYITGTILGFLAAVSFYTTLRSYPRKPAHLQTSAAAISASYHDCATFFTFSIQVACSVVLVRADYGISAASMGDATVQITWTVSLLTLSPSVYGIVLLDRQTTTTTAAGEETESMTKRKNRSDRGSVRLFLFILCWLLGCYPFSSRMIESYGASAIGGGAGQPSVVSTTNWTVIQDMCSDGVDVVSTAEVQAMDAFGIIGFLLVSIFALTIIVASGSRRHYPHITAKLTAHSQRLPRSETGLLLAMSAVTPMLSVGLIWTFFRSQKFQSQLAQNAGTADADAAWSFGQVVAVTVFAPVSVEARYAWPRRVDFT